MMIGSGFAHDAVMLVSSARIEGRRSIFARSRSMTSSFRSTQGSQYRAAVLSILRLYPEKFHLSARRRSGSTASDGASSGSELQSQTWPTMKCNWRIPSVRAAGPGWRIYGRLDFVNVIRPYCCGLVPSCPFSNSLLIHFSSAPRRNDQFGGRRLFPWAGISDRARTR